MDSRGDWSASFAVGAILLACANEIGAARPDGRRKFDSSRALCDHAGMIVALLAFGCRRIL